MRALLLVFVLSATALARESPFRTIDGRPESIASLAKESDKPVLVALLHDGCDPSVAMERDVFSDPAVAAELRESFVAVAVRDPDMKTCARFGFPEGGWPSFVLFGRDGKEIDRDFYSSSKEEFLWTLGLWKSGKTIAVLRKDVEARPDDAERRFLLGKRLVRRQEKDALDEVRRAVELDRGASHAWSAEARWLLLDERSDERVLADADAFVRRWPESPFVTRAHFKLAFGHAARGETREAIASFEHLRTHGALMHFEVDYARLLAFEGGDAMLGLELIDSVLERAPASAACHDIRAECLERLGRNEDALAAARRAVELSRDEGDRREFRRALRERRKRCAPAESAK